MHSQVQEIQRLGIDAHVACEQTSNLEQFAVSNIHCLRDEPRWRQYADRGMRKFLLRRHLDFLTRIGEETSAQVVHSHFGNVAWENLGAVRKLGAKHVVTFYGWDVNKLPQKYRRWRRRYKDLFCEADLFLCEGPHMARCLVGLGCPDSKVKVQHLGVGVDEIDFRPRHRRAGEPLRVLIAASFREKKGIPVAITSLGTLKSHYDIELTVIGDAGADARSQREKTRILEALNKSGLEQRTRMMGFQSHKVLLDEAYRHHLFLQPSITASDGDTEGGAPVSIIEMLATGMMVVSTTHCDIPDVMGPRLQYLLAPEGDVKLLAQKLQAAVADFDAWPEMAKVGRARIESEYCKKEQAERLVSRYADLTTCGNKNPRSISGSTPE